MLEIPTPLEAPGVSRPAKPSELGFDPKITSLTDSPPSFCEEDYAVTLYIAEFINTFTNLAYSEFVTRLVVYPTTGFALTETSY